MKLDIGQFPAIAHHLGPLLEQIEARSLSPERLIERYGWIAHELINGGFWDDAQYSLLNDALGLLADGMDAKRLCNADLVDAFWAELLVVAGLRARFGEDFGYESLATTKGRNPDACLPNAKVIFEVAFVDEWQVSLDRTKLQNLLGQKLRQAGFKGELRVKLDHPLTIPAPHDWADKIAAWALEQPFDGSMTTGRLLYTDSGRPDGKVHFEMRFRPGPVCMVKCEAPNFFPLTSQDTASAAQTSARSMGAVVAAPQGISVVDHIRRRVRKKTNRQMEPGWTGIVVIVARIDMEPHVTWDIVLNQVLEGDELVAVSVDNLSEPSLVQVEGTGVWRNGQNTRLAGAIGVTIGLRGDVVELRTCSRDPDALPDQIKELMRTRVDSQCGRLLPAVLSGGTDDHDENPRGE